MRTASSSLLVVVALAFATPALGQGEVAVLAVDTSALGPSAGDPLPAADAMRRVLAENGVPVLTADDTARRLRSLGLSTSHPLSTYESRLQAAEDAYAALDTERSIELLESALRDLAADGELSPQKQVLLERSRVRAAERLMALAGTSEQGSGETALGQRALSHLVDALRANDELALSQTEYPPKMHRLLARAREVSDEAGRGGIKVTSTPSGATVFIEGRDVGATPLELTSALPRGPHRVWVELDDARSVTRWVEVGDDTATLDVDLAFEGALWASGPGLRPVRGQTITEGVAAKVAGLLGVGQLVLVGFANYDEARWLYGAVYDGSEEQTVRRGAVRLAGAAPTDEDVRRLGAFLFTGDGLADASAVPPTVLPAGAGEAQVAAADEEGDLSGPLLWTGVGVGAGAVVLGGIAAGAFALIALTSGEPPPRAGHFDLEVQP